jgi:hypothetical protein
MENQGQNHIVWMDNLFTIQELLSYLRKHHVGAAGTVRTSRTKREMKETLQTSKPSHIQPSDTERSKPSQPSQPSYTSHTPNPPDDDDTAPTTATGIDHRLVALKTQYTGCLDWGEVFAIAKEDVLQFTWKDAQVVLFMTTIHDGQRTAIRLRKRP